MAIFSETKYSLIASNAINYWGQADRRGSLRPHMIRAVNEANSSLTPEQFREAMVKIGKILGSRKKERKAGTSKRIGRKKRETFATRDKSNAELIASAYQKSQKEVEDMHKRPEPKYKQSLFFFNPNVK